MQFVSRCGSRSAQALPHQKLASESGTVSGRNDAGHAPQGAVQYGGAAAAGSSEMTARFLALLLVNLPRRTVFTGRQTQACPLHPCSAARARRRPSGMLIETRRSGASVSELLLMAARPCGGHAQRDRETIDHRKTSIGTRRDEPTRPLGILYQKTFPAACRSGPTRMIVAVTVINNPKKTNLEARPVRRLIAFFT